MLCSLGALPQSLFSTSWMSRHSLHLRQTFYALLHHYSAVNSGSWLLPPALQIIRRWVGPSHLSQGMGPSSGNSTHPSSSSISEKPHNWRLTCEGFKNKRGLYSFPVSMILPLLHDLYHMLIISLYNHFDEMTKTLYSVKSDAQGNESTVNDNPALKLHFKLFIRWS